MKLTTKILTGLAITAAASAAYAVTESMQADVTFVAPITLANPVNPNFGDVSTAITAGQTIVLGTGGTITGGTGAASQLGGALAAGSLDITANNTSTIDIEIGNFGGAAANFTIADPVCNHPGGGGDTICAAGDGFSVVADGTAETMAFGLTLTAVGTPTPGAQNDTFDVDVVYQ